MPKPWFFGISFSAMAWFFTRSRIFRATKSEIVALALRSIKMSLKLPTQMPSRARHRAADSRLAFLVGDF